MSNSGQAEFAALAELEEVIKHVCDELASWRRRALKAEGGRAGVGGVGGVVGGGGVRGEHDLVGLKERILSLETDNVELERRLEAARGRVQDLLKRLRFLEEQVAVQEPAR